jgi:hypothetical protein
MTRDCTCTLGFGRERIRKARSFLHHDILNLESTFVEKQPPISVTNQQQQVAMAVLESVMAVLLLVAAEVKEAAAEAEEEERKKRSCEASAHGKKSPAPGDTLKRYGSVLPGDKCEQSVSAAAS